MVDESNSVKFYPLQRYYIAFDNLATVQGIYPILFYYFFNAFHGYNVSPIRMVLKKKKEKKDIFVKRKFAQSIDLIFEIKISR